MPTVSNFRRLEAADRNERLTILLNDGLGAITLSITIYGIRNCETMKKARAWLDKHGVDYAFHDYKTAGIEREQLERWSKKVGWETLLNRAGTTFRKLPDKDKNGLSEKKALALMQAQPSMIKRPVLDLGGGKLLVGFAPECYGEAVAARK
jgi:arsenate reductase